MKKKIIIPAIAIVLCCSVFAAYLIFKSKPKTTVNVTVSLAGEAVLTDQPVAVTDTDNDGSLTLSDTLYCAHKQYYSGKVDEGLLVSKTEYGLSLDRLWGLENGGSYGYMLNNASPSSLADTVSDGDYAYFYSYEDLTSWSDCYCFFTEHTATAPAGEELNLTVQYQTYDKNWNPVILPGANVEIYCNGESTGKYTDENGTVTVSFSSPGTYTLTGAGSELTLTPPVCTVTVTDSPLSTGMSYAKGLTPDYSSHWLAVALSGMEGSQDFL